MEQVQTIKVENYLDTRMKDLFSKAERNEMCDIEFHFKEDNTRISAHRIILGNASPVFAAMTFGLLKETEAVPVEDVTSISFKKMLRFIYTGEIGISENSVVGVLYAAHKYELKELEDVCLTYIATNVKVENVLYYLNSIPEVLVKAELISTLWGIVKLNPLSVIQSKYFVSLDKTILEELLKREHLNAVSDVELFQRILEWCTHNCLEENIDPTPENKRKVMPIEYMERIIKMKLENFVSCASSEQGFFTSIEFQFICENIVKKTDTETFLATFNSITDNYEKTHCPQCSNKSKSNENEETPNDNAEKPNLDKVIEGFFQKIHNQVQTEKCIFNGAEYRKKESEELPKPNSDSF